MPIVVPASLGTPAVDQPAGYARNAWMLYPSNGRVYIGAGDSLSNTGPVTVRYWDPSDAAFHTHATSGTSAGTPQVDEEKITVFTTIDGALAIPGEDSRDSHGNWYRIDSGAPTGALVKHVEDSIVLHVEDFYSDGTRWFLCGSHATVPVIVSTNFGTSWSNATFTSETSGDGAVAAGRDLGRRWFVLNSELYCSGSAYRQFGDGSIHYINWLRYGGSGVGFLVPDYTTSLGMWPGIAASYQAKTSGATTDLGIMAWKIVSLGSQIFYIGGTSTGSPVWSTPVADSLFRCSTFGSASHCALPGAPQVMDLFSDGSKVYALTVPAPLANGSQTMTVYESSDGVTWTETLHFTAASFCRSFALLNGIWYFGTGQLSSGGSNVAGEILQFDTNWYLPGPHRGGRAYLPL